MSTVFISYRRSGVSAYVAPALHKELTRRFGRNGVFLDTAAIEGGAEFMARIEREIRACRVLLVMIHDGWIDVLDEGGKRRLDQDHDYVRREIELATTHERLIIPVLVGSARMPTRESLPATIAHLADLNALPLRPGRDFERDVHELAKTIDRRQTLHRWTALGAAVLGVGVVIGFFVWPAYDEVAVSAGPSLVGCNRTVDYECTDDEPEAHTVDVPAFRIDRTEVTVEQYARCVDAGACSTVGLTTPFSDGRDQPEIASWCNWGVDDRRTHPINCLTWEQARTYCAWSGKRLPREDEWEKAARGQRGWKYPWGNDGYDAVRSLVANVADTTARAQFPEDWRTENGFTATYDDGFAGTAPAESFPAGASPYGALNMVGNVWEWVEDGVDDRNVVRGGSWFDLPELARASSRDLVDRTNRLIMVGVRCTRGESTR